MARKRRLLVVLTAGILATFGSLHVEAAPTPVQRAGHAIQDTSRDTAKPRWCKKKKNKNKPACKKGGGGGGGGGGGTGPCDPSYPDFCIEPPPPDLDCADVPGSNFTVVGNDPHGFDGDGDGVGCES